MTTAGNHPPAEPPIVFPPSLENVPAELRALEQWVVWQFQSKNGSGEYTKVPLYVPEATPGRLAAASATDVRTWVDAQSALRSFESGATYRGRKADGVGLVVAGSDLVIVDFDACVRDDKSFTIDPWAAFWVDRLGSYTEYSPSHSGVHVIVRAKKPWTDGRGTIKVRVHGEPARGTAHDVAATELLYAGRYCTITGFYPDPAPRDLRENQDAIDDLYAWLVAQDPGQERRSRRQQQGIDLPQEPTSPLMEDAEVLERACAARNGDAFRTLYDHGDVSAYGGDDSSADAALCAHLSFWTQDEGQVDRLFRASALMRPKWDEPRGPGQTYGSRTVAFALANTDQHYTLESDDGGDVAVYLSSSNSSIRNAKHDRKLPNLDDDAFHGLAGDIVRLIEPQTEACAPALLLTLLAMAGNAMGRNPHATVGRGGRHGTNIFVCLVGRTAGGRKGTSADEIDAVMRRAAASWCLERRMTGLNSGEGLIHHVRDREVKANKDGGEIEIDPGVTDKRLLVTEEEFCSPVKVMTREGNTLSARMREAWDGKTLGNMTRHNAQRATNPHISVLGHVTKDELLKYLTETEMGDGFANRILWCMSEMSKKLADGGDYVDIEPVALKLRAAIDFAHNSQTPYIRDAEAKVFWRNIYENNLLAERPGLFGAVTSRAEAQTLRLSIIYAVLDRSSDVKLKHIKAAYAVWQYCQESARRIFGERTGNSVADRILMLLRDAGENGLLTTELHEKLGRHQKADRVHGALVQLMEMGLVVLANSDARGHRFRAVPVGS